MRGRQRNQLLPHFRRDATLSRNGGYRDTKAHSRSVDRIVTNGTRGIEQWVAVFRFSGSTRPMDQPSAVADWLCSCSAWSVAGNDL